MAYFCFSPSFGHHPEMKCCQGSGVVDGHLCPICYPNLWKTTKLDTLGNPIPMRISNSKKWMQGKGPLIFTEDD